MNCLNISNMGSFEEFGLKLLLIVVLVTIWRLVSIKSQGHYLTSDSGSYI